MSVVWGYPGRWTAQIRRPVLGAGNRFVVNLNGHTDVSGHETLAEASLEAARLNYEHGSYNKPMLFGLDGVA